ncbi:MAG: hypothetical protein EI684_09120, partial [Candidatus Viridilinea halotolerans]
GSGCGVRGAGFRVQGSGFGVQGSGCGVRGSGFGAMAPENASPPPWGSIDLVWIAMTFTDESKDLITGHL